MGAFRVPFVKTFCGKNILTDSLTAPVIDGEPSLVIMIPKLAYDINPFIRMIQQESKAEELRYRDEIESPLSNVCEAADALGPLVLKEQFGKFYLKLTGDVCYSRFREGDRVEIRIKVHTKDLSERFADDWSVVKVSYPLPGKIEVIVFSEKPAELSYIKEVYIFKSLSTKFNNILIQKLSQFLPLSKNDKNDEFIKTNLSTSNELYLQLYTSLNSSQKTAIDYLIHNNLNGAIQGPPGTGKTQLLRAVIELALSSNLKVCVASFTNAAVDNLLGRIVSSNLNYEWYRVGDHARVRNELYPKELDSNYFVASTFSNQVNEANLIGATLHKIAFNKRAPEFDLLVVDEAGQVPIYFWPFILQIAKRVVLVGDQFQLPPVLAAKHADLAFDNLFSSLVNKETPMLETQYRMHREIQAWSAEKFYKGKLAPHASVADRDYFANNPAAVTDRIVVSKQVTTSEPGKTSNMEANFIVDKIDLFLKNNTDLSNIGVICPYRAQAGLIVSGLQNRFGVEAASKVIVDTVERFQGQEKEAIFLTFGSSIASRADMDFLSDPKRLNVSITRAKSRFYCLYDSKLWRKSFDSYELNEFFRWVADGKTVIRRAA